MNIVRINSSVAIMTMCIWIANGKEIATYKGKILNDNIEQVEAHLAAKGDTLTSGSQNFSNEYTYKSITNEIVYLHNVDVCEGSKSTSVTQAEFLNTFKNQLDKMRAQSVTNPDVPQSDSDAYKKFISGAIATKCVYLWTIKKLQETDSEQYKAFIERLGMDPSEAPLDVLEKYKLFLTRLNRKLVLKEELDKVQFNDPMVGKMIMDRVKRELTAPLEVPVY